MSVVRLTIELDEEDLENLPLCRRLQAFLFAISKRTVDDANGKGLRP